MTLVVCSLNTEGIGAAMSVEGATDGSAFEIYVEHFLTPTLEWGAGVGADRGDGQPPPGPQER